MTPNHQITVCFPGSPTIDHVIHFARQMEAKLAKNRHKGDAEGWRKMTPLQLYRRLLDECRELRDALDTETPQYADVLSECADIANFALMIADVAKILTSPEPQP